MRYHLRTFSPIAVFLNDSFVRVGAIQTMRIEGPERALTPVFL